MQRHPEYTRERIAQVGRRIRRLIHADARDPDSLPGRRAGRPHLAGRRREGLEYRRRRAGRALRAAVGDVLVPGRGDRARRSGRASASTCSGSSHSEATLWIGRALRAGPEHRARDGARPDAPVLEPAAGGGAARPARRARLQRLFGELPRPYASLEPVVLDRCEIARFDRRGLAAPPRLRRRCAARGRAATGSTRPGPAGCCSRAEPLLQRLGRGRPAILGRGRAILTTLLANRTARTSHELSAIGHAHIDTAWLWPLAETYRKMRAHLQLADRATWTTTPSTASPARRPSSTTWIKERNPDLYERIRAARRARAVACRSAARWVEPDCNLPSGESLVRQFLHGQRFFEREFGRRCREFWNPDVFGYNGQLPQIMRGAGIDALPHAEALVEPLQPPPSTTRSRGRGSTAREVLAHFPPADTYNATADGARSCAEARATTRTTTTRARSLLVFGYGDGGGGPTPEMLETLRRARDLQGLPRTTHAHAARSSSTALEAERRRAARPSSASSTSSTTAAPTRLAGRASSAATGEGEQALHDAELLPRSPRGPAPRIRASELDRLWKLLLLQPVPRHPARLVDRGSSTRTPRATSPRCAPGRTRSRTRLAALAGGGGRRRSTPSASRGREVVGRRRLGRGARRTALGARRSSAGAVTVAERRRARRSRTRTCASTLGRDGRVASLRRTGRAAARRSPRRATASSSTTTDPTAFDAWDIDPFHLETRARLPRRRRRASVTRRAPLRAEVAFERPVGRASTMRQVVRLDAGSRAPRVPLRGRLARVAHAAEGAASRSPCAARNATYEMQFGARRAADALLDEPRPAPATRCPATASPISPSTASASRS